MSYPKEQIRNVAIVGGGGAGKTSLVEAILYNAKLTTRLGKVEEGNTVSDNSPDEIARCSSIYTSLCSFVSGGVKLNILDTPGYYDFVGETMSAITAADAAIFVLPANTDIDASFEMLWEIFNKPKAIFLNKLDKEDIDLNKNIDMISQFDKAAVPFILPDSTGVQLAKVFSLLDSTIPDNFAAFKEKLIETVASNDDVLIEKYLEGKEISKEELISSFKKGILGKTLIPILSGSSTKNIGCDSLINFIKDYFPFPDTGSEQAALSALVFKSVVEPHSGNLSFVKLLSGKITQGADIKNVSRRSSERFGTLCTLLGKKRSELKDASAGDICVAVKLKDTHTNDVLGDDTLAEKVERVAFPEPNISMAVYPKSKGEEEKVASALQSMMKEDLTVKSSYNAETKEMILSGMGMVHLETGVGKIKSRYGVDVELRLPRVAYRETVRGKCEVQGKYKRQTGGRGQYGDCWIKLEPKERGAGYEFVNAIREGRIPKNYIPAVEKGIKEAMEQGVIAGYPVTDIKVTLYDGSYHEVDSSDMAFKIAGSMAFKKGVVEAKPLLLEPIFELEIVIPDEYMGNVMGDLNSKRGRVMGMERAGRRQKVIAAAPLSEVGMYSTDLRSITKGAGSFKMKFSHYEEAPSNVAQPLIELYQKHQQEGR